MDREIDEEVMDILEEFGDQRIDFRPYITTLQLVYSPQIALSTASKYSEAWPSDICVLFFQAVEN